MKDKLLLLLLLSTFSYSEVSTIIPYYGKINYGDKGHRVDGKIHGFYASRGDLDYLIELTYLHTDINEKSPYADNLSQDEISLMYGRYFNDFAYKIGLHTTNTSDPDLGKSYTLTTGLSRWKWYGYDKLTYGADLYNSYYSDGHDLAGFQTAIYVHQLTPYIAYSKSLNTSSTNIFELRANYQSIPLFKRDTSYNSYEVKNTFYYKKASVAGTLFKGEMRMGTQDGGMTIFNLKDIQNDGYSAKVAYDITKKFNTSLSYVSKEFEEFGSKFATKNSLIVFAVKYTF